MTNVTACAFVCAIVSVIAIGCSKSAPSPATMTTSSASEQTQARSPQPAIAAAETPEAAAERAANEFLAAAADARARQGTPVAQPPIGARPPSPLKKRITLSLINVEVGGVVSMASDVEGLPADVDEACAKRKVSVQWKNLPSADGLQELATLSGCELIVDSAIRLKAR